MASNQYPTDYAKALTAKKYGRADPERTTDFVTQSWQSGNQDPNSFADQLLADHLQDADDPYHHVVRGDMEIRQNPGSSWTYKVGQQSFKMLGVSHLGDDVLWGNEHQLNPETTARSMKTKDGKQVIFTTWSPKKTDGMPNFYEAYLRPDHFNELAANEGFPHTAESLANEPHH